MKSNRRMLPWIGLPLTLALLLLTFADSGERSATPRAIDIDRAPLLTATAAGTTHAGDEAQRNVRVYAVQSRRHVAMSAGSDLPAIDVRVQLQARVEVRVYGAHRIGVSAPEFEIECSSQGRRERGDLAGTMSREVAVVLDARGHPARIVHAAGTGVETRRQWCHILDAICVARGGGRNRETQERDEIGLCRVAYVADGEGALTRTKLEYVELNGKGTTSPSLSGEARFEFTGDALARASGDETICFAIPAANRRVTAHNRFRVELVAVDRRRLEAPSLEQAEAQQQSAQPRVRLVELVGNLDALVAAGQRRSHRTHREVMRLVELIRSSATVADEVLKLARTDTLVPLATAALAAADTSAAQEALRRLASARGRPTSHRRAALFSLVRVSRPSRATLETLRALRGSNDLADTAALILGGLGGKLRDSDAETFASIEAELVEALDGAATPGERTTALEALGNFGPSTIPDGALHALSDPNAFVRTAAVRSLARTPDERAPALLRDAARNDADESVRASALTMLDRRGETTPALLDELMHKDESDLVQDHARRLAQKS